MLFVIITWVDGQKRYLKTFTAEGMHVTTANPDKAQKFANENLCQLTHRWLAQHHPATWHWGIYPNCTY